MASASSAALLDALRRDAIASFHRATSPPENDAPSSSPHRTVAAVDSALHVVLEVLAFGAGGRQLYDDLHITRLVSVNTLSMDALAVRRQVGLDGVAPGRWPDHTIAFILPPSQANVQLLAHVLSPFLTTTSAIQCAVLWQPAATSESALEMERQGLAGVVQQRNLALGLLPVDRNVATLCHDRVFAELYVHGQHHSLTRVVQSILATETQSGSRIAQVTCHGPFASRVKSMLDMAHTLQPPAATGSSHFDRLILIDRMEDPLSMLLTPMTYEGLLDAVIGMNHGVVSFEKPATSDEELTSETERVKLLLNHMDELFDEIRDVNINTLISHRLGELTQQLVAGTATVKTASTIAQIREQLQNVPHLVKKKKALGHHLVLVEQIQQKSQHLGLRTCVETEMAILSGALKRGIHVGTVSAGKDVDRLLEEILLRDEPKLLDVYDVLKLLCLLSLVSGGLKEDRLLWYRTQLCHSYGYHLLPLLVQLDKLELLSTKNKFDYQRRRKELALMRGVLEDDDDTLPVSSSSSTMSASTPSDIHFMFPYTGYAPMSVRLVQTSLGMKIKPTSDMGNLFSVSSTASLPGSTGTATQTPTGPRHVLVYYLGGVTVAELAAYRWLNATQTEFAFFIATTAICNGSRLLRAV